MPLSPVVLLGKTNLAEKTSLAGCEPTAANSRSPHAVQFVCAAPPSLGTPLTVSVRGAYGPGAANRP